jgi:hypothetical protein
MTLKEQITKDVLDMPLINSPTKKEISEYEKGIFNLEKIVEEFAIGFARWLTWRKNEIITKELLEIYKKEKGL